MNINNIKQSFNARSKKLAGASLVLLVSLAIIGAVLVMNEAKPTIAASNCQTIGASCTKEGETTCACANKDGVILHCVADQKSNNLIWNAQNDRVITCVNVQPSSSNTTTNTNSNNEDTEAANKSTITVSNSNSTLSADAICAKAGQSCNPANDKVCVWCAGMASKPHAYCSSADNKWHVDNNVQSYCQVCSEDAYTCSCSFPQEAVETTGNATTQQFFRIGQFRCGAKQKQSENFSYSCVAGPKYSQDTGSSVYWNLFEPTVVPCLNQQCNEGTGQCEDMPSTATCNQMNSDVQTIIGYINKGCINRSGYYNDTIECQIYKESINNFKNKYSSMWDKMINGARTYFANRIPTKEQIACANIYLHACNYNNGVHQFDCVSGWNGCLVWNWLGSGGKNKDPKLCTAGCDEKQGTCINLEETPATGECESGQSQCSGNTVEEADSQCSVCGQNFVCNLTGGQTPAAGYCIQGCRVNGELKQVPPTGKCTDYNINGTCQDISVTKGIAKETTSTCESKQCSGICVSYNVTTSGDCSGLTCVVSNDYDSGKATGYKGSDGNGMLA